MHSHNVWSSEALHVLEYLWEGTVLEQHRVSLREGEGREEGVEGRRRRGVEGEKREEGRRRGGEEKERRRGWRERRRGKERRKRVKGRG